MDVDILLLMVFIEQLMYLYQEKKFLYLDMVMLEKDVHKLLKLKMQQFMLKKSIQFVLYKLVWKDLELLKKKQL